jgi:hypothetical protein
MPLPVRMRAVVAEIETGTDEWRGYEHDVRHLSVADGQGKASRMTGGRCFLHAKRRCSARADMSREANRFARCVA